MSRHRSGAGGRLPGVRSTLVRFAAAAVAVGCAAGTDLRVDSAPPGLGKPSAFAGRWSALSDWALVVDLEENGSARIQHTWWDGAGEELREISGDWTQRGEQIELRYGGVTDTLRFEKALPLSSTGAPGTRPALSPVPPVHPRSLLGSASLWWAPDGWASEGWAPEGEPR